ncbi:hypothetical protein BHE74_00008307 [Ensete ventricosum]|nr:hypothetical protein BHE74_00008307 [Ensete ventricosum]
MSRKLLGSTRCSLLFFVALFLRPPTSASWDNSQPECPYPCLPPPTSVTNCPPPPPAAPATPTAGYPPPPPSTPGYWNYPPPSPQGYYPYLSTPPPPNPILPWFPWYYYKKSPPSASVAPPLEKDALRKMVISVLGTTMCLVLV